jgi:predicted  nucleic acid-binding Zn-ribbon protein
MKPQNTQDSQVKFLLSDFNTRLRDLDERNKLIRERVLLLGKNLISSRSNIDNEIKEIKQNNLKLNQEIERLTKTTSALLSEFSKFVKREELMIIERMLKDFQPLDFVRKKDINK